MRMKVQETKPQGGLGLFGVVQVVLLVLKLCGLINWSWWCVLIPLWISLGIFVIALLVIVAAGLWSNRKSGW